MDRGYGIPADNPFALVPGIAGEIWAFGLRHPQHFSFDAAGRMLITDIGENNIEEVNLGRAGANYGWRLREGTFATRQGIGGTPLGQGPVFTRPDETSGTFDYPVVQYDHDEGRALGSGFVYEGSAIPSLLGKYVFADLVNGRLFAVDADALTPGEQPEIEEVRFTFDGVEQTLLDVAGYPNPSRLIFDPNAKRADLCLGLDHDGELYILTKGDGWIRRLADGSVADDATLSALSLSGIDIGTFSGDMMSYTASVEHAVETTTVTASATHASASVVITPGAEVNLSEGANVIQVTVTAEDGSTAAYTVTVTRAEQQEEEEKSAAPLTATIEGPPGMSVADARASEGPGASLAFAVTLDRAPRRTATVNYETHAVTATEGEDYTRGAGMLTFEAGETSKTVSVAVLEDEDDTEGEETLTLRLSGAVLAWLADREATGTIGEADAVQNALVDGVAVVLVWPTPRDGFGTPSGSDYAVRVNGTARRVVSAQLSGRTGHLELASPVLPGDAVTVSYVDSAMHPLAYAGGRLRSGPWEGLAAVNVTGTEYPLPVTLAPVPHGGDPLASAAVGGAWTPAGANPTLVIDN